METPQRNKVERGVGMDSGTEISTRLSVCFLENKNAIIISPIILIKPQKKKRPNLS